MQKTLKRAAKSPYFYGGLLLALTLFRLALSFGLMLAFRPGSGYDDIMQISKAFSMSGGQWLGEYGSMTLVKGAGYPLLATLFSWLGLPHIPAFHALYAVACALFLLAIFPCVKNKWFAAALYVFLLFNPVAFSASITRLYRDIGYYAVAFLCVACTMGFLLRYNTKKITLWGLGAGFCLALSALMREDSQWLYALVGGCLAAYLISQWAARRRNFRRTLKLPAVLLAGWLVPTLFVCGMNAAWYGSFALDEYNSGAFAKAYGALSRLGAETEDPRVTIPHAQRAELYELSPSFAELYELLDGDDALFAAWKTEHGDYRTGFFSFVLRDAAAMRGKYKNAQTASAYFEALANEVNAVCDAGLMSAGSPHSGVAPRFYPWMLGPVAQATGQSAWSTLRCEDIDPRPVPVDADDAYLARFEDLVHSPIAANRYIAEGNIAENYHYTGAGLFLQRAMRLVVLAYRLVLAPLFIAACALYVLAPLAARLKKKKMGSRFWMLWVAGGSLLCAFLLRSAMLGVVHVGSFGTVGSSAYQAAGYPLVLGFITLTAVLCANAYPVLFRTSRGR